MNIQQNSKITVHTHKMVHFILTSNILYLHAKGSSTYIALVDGQIIKVSKNLKYVHNLMGDEQGFYSPHRSYIININYVENLVSDKTKFKIVLIGGEKIPLIKKKRANFLINYKVVFNAPIIENEI